MLSNDVKKGTEVVLRNGWKARIEDNARGLIRLATVYGYFTEMGSIYMFDIAEPKIEFTPSQMKQIARIKSWR